MLIFPNSKINLGLNVTAKREDGYHNLETIFYPINICDALEVNYADEGHINDDILVIRGVEIEGDVKDNLILKAVNLLRKDYDFPKLKFNLLKKIPMGAGLGGGSADGAYTLRLLNDFLCLSLSNIQLAEYALKLGADCPFFIYNTPMYAEGVGEILTSINLSIEDHIITVVKPNLFISTKEAFENIKPKTSKYSLVDIISRPIEEWHKLLKNDFEESLFQKYPILQHIKQKLYENGAIYSSMSGSGSSIFAISKQPIKNLEKDFSDFFIWESI